jgi:hypothetical protein
MVEQGGEDRFGKELTEERLTDEEELGQGTGGGERERVREREQEGQEDAEEEPGRTEEEEKEEERGDQHSDCALSTSGSPQYVAAASVSGGLLSHHAAESQRYESVRFIKQLQSEAADAPSTDDDQAM